MDDLAVVRLSYLVIAMGTPKQVTHIQHTDQVLPYQALYVHCINQIYYLIEGETSWEYLSLLCK